MDDNVGDRFFPIVPGKAEGCLDGVWETVLGQAGDGHERGSRLSWYRTGHGSKPGWEKEGVPGGSGPRRKWRHGGTGEPVLVGEQVLQKQSKTC